MCINGSFKLATIDLMKKMHAQMARLYEAARQANLLDETREQASMSRLLNVAQQNVNNWEARGPSKEAVLEAQHRLGVSATWILLGKLPMMIGGDAQEISSWPFRSISPERYELLSDKQQEAIEEWINNQITAYTGATTNSKSTTAA